MNDSTSYIGVKNTLGIALLEGFNKYAKAGLTAFISHKLSNYRLMDRDSVSVDKYSEHEVFVGGELAKRQGKHSTTAPWVKWESWIKRSGNSVSTPTST